MSGSENTAMFGPIDAGDEAACELMQDIYADLAHPTVKAEWTAYDGMAMKILRRAWARLSNHSGPGYYDLSHRSSIPEDFSI